MVVLKEITTSFAALSSFVAPGSGAKFPSQTTILFTASNIHVVVPELPFAMHCTLPGTYVVPDGIGSVTLASIAIAFELFIHTILHFSSG